MKIPESKIQEINDKVSIVDLVSEYVTLSPKGGRFWGLCPFHDEKTPSFSVTQDKNIYYCFGCHKGGGAINFLMEIEKLAFPEAVQLLAKKAGVALDLEKESSEYSGTRDALLELYKRVAASFNYILLNTPSASEALAYIEARGIARDMIEQFQLGYAPNDFNWLYAFLKKNNYSEQFLKDSGLFSKKKSSFPLFVNRLMFPVFSPRSEIIGFSGRELGGDRGPKYINTPETYIFHKGSQLFGIAQAIREIRTTRHFVLCEGNVDVLALHQSGIKNAVAPLGTAFTADQARLLKRYADSGTIVFDGDEAGAKATARASIICETAGLDVSVAPLPTGRDPADILQKDGAELLKKIVKYPITSFEYLYNCAIRAYDVKTPEGMERTVRELFPYISSIRSDVKRDAYLNRLAGELGIARESILGDFSRQKTVPVRREVRKKDEIIRISDELYLMLAGAANRDYFNIISNSLGVEDLKDVNAIQLFRAVTACNETGEQSTDALLIRIGEGELRTLVMEKLSSSQFLINPEEVIRDSVKTILLRNMVEKRTSLEAEIARSAAGGAVSKEVLEKLISEKLSLDKKIEEFKR